MLLTVNKMTCINLLLRYQLAVMHETKDLVHEPHESDRKWMHHGCVSNVRVEQREAELNYSQNTPSQNHRETAEFFYCHRFQLSSARDNDKNTFNHHSLIKKGIK